MLNKLLASICLVLSLNIGLAQADLTITGDVIMSAPNPVHVGISVSASFSVKNIGNASSANTQTAILISSPTNAIPATVIKKISLEALAPGASSENIQVTFPVPYHITTSGEYRIVVVINYDETTTESGYLNNIAGASIQVNHEPWAAQNLPYPIILIHGLTGSNLTWDPLIDFMKSAYGWSYGGNMNFCLNFDRNLTTSEKNTDYHDFTDVSALRSDDFYTVNFDVNFDGVPYSNSANNQSNQSAIVKQGIAIRDAIRHVLQITGRDKVILVGHSMGGLAAREYLQNGSIWQEPYVSHHVAKLLTIGTPHGGSNATDFMLGIGDPDLLSEAVRDLRTKYLISSQPGAYLFNGAEDNDYLKDLPGPNYYFYNVDVNCNGTPGDFIEGINTKNISKNLAYSCLVGTGQLLPVTGDGVVTEYSANINNFQEVNADVFNVPKPTILPIDPTWHSELVKQFADIMKGVDEPNTSIHAYQVTNGQLYYGNITYQRNPNQKDFDYYQVLIPSTGNLTIQLFNISNPEFSIEIRSSTNTSIVNIPCNGKGFLNINIQLASGQYYLVMSGTPSFSSYKYPYAFKCVFNPATSTCNSTTTLTNPSGNFSDGSGNAAYNNNSDCKWKIQPSGARSITLNFSEFSLSNPGDTVFVYNGGTTSSPILAALTGNTLPLSITSTVGTVLVRFVTDASSVLSGWSANYTSVTVPTYCNGVTTFTSMSGNFSDGSGNTNYSNYARCSWLINPPDASSITLTFNQFNTEQINDVVNIFDGNDNSATLLGSFSGNSLPNSITSSSGALFIEFITNDTITNLGWSASYSAVAPYTTTGIIEYEYWFDNDYQNRSSFNVLPQQILDLNTNIPTNRVSVGLHAFNIRFKESKGTWSSVSTNYFVKNNTRALSNKIIAYEYWFDNNDIHEFASVVNPQMNLELDSAFRTENLNHGLHTINIKFKDAYDQWSGIITNYFVKNTQTQNSNKITSYQYWFDNDYQNAIINQADSSKIFLLDVNLPTDNLHRGLHSFNIRFKADLGQWTSITTSYFIKDKSSGDSNKLANYQYWFDNDYANAVNVSISANSLFLLNNSISTGNISKGLHSFNIRFKADQSQWSSITSNFFLNKSAALFPKMKNWRYWFDTNQSTVTIKNFAPSERQINLFDTLNCSNLLTGKHFIHFQFQDSIGQWSSIMSDSFKVIQPAIPANLTSNSPQCLVTVSTTSAAPPGVIWYWQGTSCGTDTTLGHDSSYIANTSGIYHLRAFELKCGCWSADCSSIAVTINPSTAITWTGQLSTDWNNGSNWSCGLVPNSTNDVMIPAGTPHQPIIPNGTMAVCRSISILPGAVINVGENSNLQVLH